jgi:hypothetical protein
MNKHFLRLACAALLLFSSIHSAIGGTVININALLLDSDDWRASPGTTLMTISPGQTATTYVSAYGYSYFVAAHPEYSLPSMPESAGFIVEAESSSVGGTLHVQLLTLAGTPVADLGSLMLTSKLWGASSLQAFGSSAPITLSNANQTALFGASCPSTSQYVGFPSSLCTGWFRADFTNTGSIPITFKTVDRQVAPVQRMLVTLTGRSGAVTLTIGAFGAPAYGGGDVYGTDVP